MFTIKYVLIYWIATSGGGTATGTVDNLGNMECEAAGQAIATRVGNLSDRYNIKNAGYVCAVR
jgi:hypothetical protein